MGLKDLIPDYEGGKGGRPTEGSDDTVQTPGATLEDVNSDDWWEDTWDKVVSGDEPTNEEIAEICSSVFMFPWDVKTRVESLGLYEFDWEQMPDDYPSDFALAKYLEDEGVNNDFVKKARKVPKFNKPSWAPGGDKDTETSAISRDDSKSSGLAGLIEDAKD